MILFNSGVMIATPVSGNLGANPTPLALGILQDGAFDVSWEVKMLYGQAAFPVDVATGKGKVSGTAKYASVTGKGISDLFFGQGVTVGNNTPAYLENHAVPATPFQVTIAPPGSGVYLADLGVIYHATGVPFVRVASAPTVGQYSVTIATGIYLFATADTAVAGGVDISYLYTLSATGFKTVVANQLMGFGPNFELDFFITYNAQTTLVRAYSCKMTKWGLPSKQGDYLIQDVAFEAFANAAGNIFELDYTS
jgi:hypothetical protein